MTGGLSLRPATADDRPFLRAVYASTRADELAPVPWSDAQKQAFLTMQFDAQDAAYHDRYPDGTFSVVLLGGEPIGRLYTARLADEIRLVDIALLPEHRGRRLGSTLLQRLLTEADAAGLCVRLYVEESNRARTLYERLGFQLVGEHSIYVLLERQPAPRAAAAGRTADQLNTAS